MRADTVMQSDLLDILFEHRNKEYGAYTLRKEYNHRLMIALTAMFSIVILFFGWFFFNNNNNNRSGLAAVLKDDSVVINIITLPEDPLPPPPPPPAMKPQPPAATIRVTPPLIVPDNLAADPPPPVDQLDKEEALISNKTQDGEKPNGNMPVSASAGNGAGRVLPQPAPEPEPENRVMEFAEQMPEFPGGAQALIRFLSKNLRVPEDQVEPGQQVKVPVKFVVGKDGKLTDVQFPGTPDEAFKTEIRRVMNKMPKWIPGSQNGKPVAVYFNIPIVFQVSDQ